MFSVIWSLTIISLTSWQKKYNFYFDAWIICLESNNKSIFKLQLFSKSLSLTIKKKNIPPNSALFNLWELIIIILFISLTNLTFFLKVHTSPLSQEHRPRAGTKSSLNLQATEINIYEIRTYSYIGKTQQFIINYK